ncbi:MAG: zinc ribbon domain-containing protein [Phycisphaerae bacterium]|jgi:DNA-directed RNA polymerase subunit RPC12/RpoP
MAQIMWPRKLLRKFEMSGGNDKKEYLFVAALAVVIVIALILTIYFAFLGGGKTKLAAPAEEYTYKCSKCGNEFAVDQKTQWRIEESDSRMADCPKCGAKQSAYPTVKCPNPACGKYFVLESTKNPNASSGAMDNCPYCKTNYLLGLKGTYGPPK